MRVLDKELITPNAPFHYIKGERISKDLVMRQMHIHDEIELLRVSQGQVLCEFGNACLVLREGEIILINTKVPHQFAFYQSDAEIEYIQINIQSRINTILPTGNSYLYLFMNRTFKKPYMLYNCHSEIYQCFDKILEERTQKALCFRMAIGAYIDLIIVHMARNQMLLDLNNSAINSAHTQIVPAIEFVEAHYQAKFTLDELCAAIHINKYYFCKIFKKITGATLTEYVNFRRLLQAEVMLLRTSKSVAQIACECGFASNQYFTKVFKENYVLSPIAYRKHYARITTNTKTEASYSS